LTRSLGGVHYLPGHPTRAAVVTTQPDTTQLLLSARAGDRAAFDRLFAHVYDELRAVARRRLAAHRRGQTLDTTALVHEAYLRLVDGARAGAVDRAHFLALAARAMRFVLVDYARERTAAKRGGGLVAVDLPLDALPDARLADERLADERAADLLTLADALEQLAHFDPRLGEIVECRFFGGLTFEEIAALTGRSVPTVKRDWTRARAWLFRSLDAGAGVTA
jgi:RNA polymerase sigma factor (TIGR02999 family)